MKIILLITLTFCGCAATKQYIETPEGQALLQGVKQTAFDAGENALQQLSDSGKVKASAVAKASLSSVSNQVRSLQSTKDAANPTAIKDAVRLGSANSTLTTRVAPAVANAIANAVQKGLPADTANEAAASGLDQAAAKH